MGIQVRAAFVAARELENKSLSWFAAAWEWFMSQFPVNTHRLDPYKNFKFRVRWDGTAPSWTINDAPIASLAEVFSYLDQIADINPSANVILHPDEPVPMGDVIDVFDSARRAGFETVSFAASP